MAKISAAGLGKTYKTKTGTIQALDDIHLEIDDCEFIVLVGPSGCGKSTLLRMFNALLRPSCGTLLFDGQPLTAPPASVGVVFQDAVLLPWRSALDNVLLPAEILGRDPARSRQRARDLLALVGLAGFENRLPGELSGGMQQRVAICRALIHDPSLVLMDEPFAALDAMTREDLSLELLRIWEADRKTVVFVTHHIPEAVLLADRVVAMSPRPGRIARILPIGLERPRRLDMQYGPAFQAHVEEIRSLLGR